MSTPARRTVSIGLGVIALAIVVAVLALFVAPPALQPSTASAAPKTFVYKANGAGAGAVVVKVADPEKDWSGCETYVEVMRGGTRTAVETWLYYDVFVWDPDVVWTMEQKEGPPIEVVGRCEPVEVGYGMIPNSAFAGGGRSYSLNFDASADVPGFYRDFGSGGMISLTWQGTSLWSESSTGTYTRTYGRSTIRSVGPSSMTSAKATGMFLGAPLTVPTTDPDAFSDAMIRSNQGVTIEHMIGG